MRDACVLQVFDDGSDQKTAAFAGVRPKSLQPATGWTVSLHLSLFNLHVEISADGSEHFVLHVKLVACQNLTRKTTNLNA